MSKLKCPWCGGKEAEVVYDTTYSSTCAAQFYIECSQCGLRTPRYASVDTLKQVWSAFSGPLMEIKVIEVISNE